MPEWMYWAFLSAAFAALTAIFAKLGVEQIDSDVATFLRTMVVVVVLAGILVFRAVPISPGSISTKTYVFLFLSGLGTGASWLCYFRALQIGDAARVAPIDKLSVVLVAIAGAAFLGEQLELHHWIGVFLIASGAVLVAMK